MSQATINPSTEAASLAPLDRTQRPAIPAAVADLWDGWDYHGDANDPVQVRAALDGISNVVCALAGDRYAVSLQDSGTAWTDLQAKRVAITAAALRDPRLTVAEALAVTTAMSAHEGGHGRVSGPMAKAVERKWSHGTELMIAQRLSNIVDDVRLEADTEARWTAYAGLFDIALWWVAQRYPSGGIDRVPGSKMEALNFAVAAIRYQRHTQWDDSVPGVADERTWWANWGADAAQQQRPIDHVRAIEKAMQHIADLPDSAPLPEKPEQPEGFPGEAEADDSQQDGQQDGQQPPQDATDGGWGLPTESDEDEAGDEPQDGSQPGEQGEADEAEDGQQAGEGDEQADEAGDEQGAGDEAGDAGDDAGEQESDAPGDQPGETPAPSAGGDESADSDSHGEDDSLGGADDDGSHTEGGEVTYHVNEGAAGREQPNEGRNDGDDVTYSQGEGDNFDGTEAEAEMPAAEGREEYERDALADPLPVHATDAVSRDDRNRDIRLGDSIASVSTDEAQDRITVTHMGPRRGMSEDGQTSTHQVEVGTVYLTTDRERIATDPAIQNALADAFTAKKSSHDTREVSRSGRLSGSRVHRITYGGSSVFTRREGLSPDRLDLHLLVDASGSMSGSDWSGYGVRAKPRVVMAAQMAANISEALTRLGTARVHVWAHNTAHGTTLWDVFDSQRGDALARIAGITTAGANNDASAIAALTHKVVEDRKAREQSIIVVISDGAPCESEDWVRGAVENARDQGVGVVSVAISGGLSRTQSLCFGEDDVVAWTGDWDSMAQRLAEIVGRLA